MKPVFRIGITPDFYTDVKGLFEGPLEQALGGVEGVEYAPMPPQPDKLATAEALDEFDGVLALSLRFTAESVRGLKRLAVVARWGVGYDRIDVDALTRADVALAITPNAVRRPVAEAILALVFALAKNLLALDRRTRAGLWRRDLSALGYGLAGRVLGSVGCGNIAQEMFRLARPLGFGRLIACDPYVPADQIRELGVELVDLETVFRESDFVTVNVPLNESTRGLIGERHFRMMKPAAFFINTARGAIVEHEALVRALREGWIRGAGIDVFPVEPVSKDDPLLELDNVIVAPHALAWTEELVRDNTLEACRHLLAAARGQAPESVVNRDVLARPGFRRKLARFQGGA
jgi:phosphoglycerate dehydrogenase-like enzyme